MKCPECFKEDLSSKVFILHGYQTDMYCPPFYDENGDYHLHDYNLNHVNYTCSKDHYFKIIHKKKCPADNCDFNKEEK
jgi:hypothetical protein